MVPATSRAPTLLLFPMVESSVWSTPPMDMMDMLLMSPTRELPSTPRLPQHTSLSLALPLLQSLLMPLLKLLQLLLLLLEPTYAPETKYIEEVNAVVDSLDEMNSSSGKGEKDPPIPVGHVLTLSSSSNSSFKFATSLFIYIYFINF